MKLLRRVPGAYALEQRVRCALCRRRLRIEIAREGRFW